MWWIHAGETNNSNSPPSSSTAPFKPFAMMPISKTRSNQFCGLNIATSLAPGIADVSACSR
jgi:hypothetical protein